VFEEATAARHALCMFNRPLLVVFCFLVTKDYASNSRTYSASVRHSKATKRCVAQAQTQPETYRAEIAGARCVAKRAKISKY
jgi:hypothetical protein